MNSVRSNNPILHYQVAKNGLCQRLNSFKYNFFLKTDTHK